MSETRAQLLAIALKAFATSGYEAVGVAGVCTAAGVTKPTLYHHFGSKRGLLEAVVDADGTMLLGRLRALTDQTSETLPGDEIKLMLDRITETMWRTAEDRPDFYRLVLTLQAAPPSSEGGQVIRPFREALWAQIRHLYGAAAAHHGAFRGREDALAHTFLGMVHTWIGLYLVDGCVLDPPTRYRAVHGYLHGIFS